MNDTSAWIRIAYCREIPLREGRAVTVGTRAIAVFNLGDRFLAVDNRCPHKGGPLADGIVSGSTVVCPLHAWKMSLETGNGLCGPSASSCVETFRTRVEDGMMEWRGQSNDADGVRKEELTVMCAQPSGIAAIHP